MWLASIGGGGERISPPLPSSILPENSESGFSLNQGQAAGIVQYSCNFNTNLLLL